MDHALQAFLKNIISSGTPFRTGNSTLSGASPNETRDWVNARIQALADSIKIFQESIEQLGSLRNTLAPINRLPNELLVEIFSGLTQDRPESTDVTHASHVCRHWRHLALTNAKLWCNIWLPRRKQALENLRRSKGALIHVSHDDQEAVCVGYSTALSVAIVVPHTHRVKSLRLSLCDTMLESMQAFALSAAPHLQELSLEKLCFDVYDICDGPIIFKDDLPALRSLSLSSVTIPWSSRILKNLVHLQLVYTHVQNSLPTLQRLLDILEQCPGLECLILRHSEPADTLAMPVTRQVDLPCLSTLRLESTFPRRIATLLEHLSIPADTAMRLVTLLGDEDVGEYPMLPGDCSALRPLSQLRALEFYGDRRSGVTVRGRTGRTAAFAAPLFELKMNMVQLPNTAPKVALSCLRRLVDLTHVDTFVLSGFLHTEQAVLFEEWMLILAPFANLRTLHIVKMGPVALMNLLVVTAVDGRVVDPQRDEFMFCPKLEVLQLTSVKFKMPLQSHFVAWVRLRAPYGLHTVEMLDVAGWKDGEVQEMKAIPGVEVLVNE
ncbi:hypothetical protein B0H21DRAFT_154796 [Amylocystis lapponica]|nr:hypothetical protein B0H21DRAFT_154796 [Amylocystis lapponica]